MREGIKKIDTVKSEHLKSGINPIIVSIGLPEDFLEKNEKFPAGIPPYKFGLKNPEQIVWMPFPGYAISEINSRDKFSQHFAPCTGIVVKGIDKKTNKNVSFLSHQSVSTVLSRKEYLPEQEEFIDDLMEHLENIKAGCVPGTIDAVIIGGESNENYLKVVKRLSTKIKSVLGFEPVIVNGPKEVTAHSDNIYFNNEIGRLYFVRPQINQAKDFTHSDIRNNK